MHIAIAPNRTCSSVGTIIRSRNDNGGRRLKRINVVVERDKVIFTGLRETELDIVCGYCSVIRHSDFKQFTLAIIQFMDILMVDGNHRNRCGGFIFDGKIIRVIIPRTWCGDPGIIDRQTLQEHLAVVISFHDMDDRAVFRMVVIGRNMYPIIAFRQIVQGIDAVVIGIAVRHKFERLVGYHGDFCIGHMGILCFIEMFISIVVGDIKYIGSSGFFNHIDRNAKRIIVTRTHIYSNIILFDRNLFRGRETQGNIGCVMRSYRWQCIIKNGCSQQLLHVTGKMNV